MANLIKIAQLIIAVILIVLVLIQEKGSGVGESFGGSQTGFYQHRRGLEKVIFIITLVFLALFAGVSVASLLIR